MEIDPDYARSVVEKFKTKRGSADPFLNSDYFECATEDLQGAVQASAWQTVQNCHQGNNQVPVIDGSPIHPTNGLEKGPH